MENKETKQEGKVVRKAHHALVVRCLTALGRPRTDGGEDTFNGSIEPLMPWMVMDAHYCLYHDAIEPLSCGYMMAKHRRDWIRAYRRFNHPFWAALPEQDSEALIDLMDDLSEAVAGDIAALRDAVMLATPCDDEGVRRAIASAYVCQVLAIIAGTIYTKIYRTFKPVPISTRSIAGREMSRAAAWKPSVNGDIAACERYAALFYGEVCKQAQIGKIILTDGIQELSGALARRVVRWMAEQDDNIND